MRNRSCRRCVLCRGPLGYNNHSGVCSCCRRRHECPVCLEVEADKLPREWCSDCKEAFAAFRALYSDDAEQLPHHDLAARLAVLCARADDGLPLFGDAP